MVHDFNKRSMLLIRALRNLDDDKSTSTQAARCR